jgi:uncharacterized membrane protein YphA (DoxX/SURF4 family)
MKRIVRILPIVLRIMLGLVFVYAAWTKLREPWHLFAMSVDAYGLLPSWAVIVVARTLPWAELLIGVFLISGWQLRIFAAAASLLLLGFFSVMVRSHIAGLQIDCGCFGGDDPISPRTLARDGSLLAASLLLTAMAIWRARRTEAI